MAKDPLEIDSQLRESLITGIDLIDEQHVELFGRIDSLQAAVASRKSNAEIEDLIGYLERYASRHGALEEGYMTLYDYEFIDEHRAEHAELRKAVEGLREKLDAYGVNDDVVNQAVRVVTEWLVNHIHVTDQKFAAFLRSVT